MKKKIIICAFSALILITAILVIIAAIDSYHYDMDPANGVDIMEGFGTAMLIVLADLSFFTNWICFIPRITFLSNLKR